MDKEEIKEAVKEAVEAHIVPLYIERQQHYDDHVFLKELREFIDSVKSNTLKTIIKVLITGLMAATAIGLIIINYSWVKNHFK